MTNIWLGMITWRACGLARVDRVDSWFRNWSMVNAQPADWLVFIKIN